MKGIELRVIPSNAVVKSDQTMLMTIVNNLVGNAIKYTHRGGLLVACRRHGDKAHLEVWDTGIGIPQVHQIEVFEDFRRLDTSRDGFGLGLSIVRRTAEVLKHRVRVISKERRGSRFTIELPLVL